jgi:hypothetical protein
LDFGGSDIFGEGKILLTAVSIDDSLLGITNQCSLISEKLVRIYSQAHEKVAMRARINCTRYNFFSRAVANKRAQALRATLIS